MKILVFLLSIIVAFMVFVGSIALSAVQFKYPEPGNFMTYGFVPGNDYVRTLIQWKFKCDRTDLYDMGEEILPNGWVQWYIPINCDYPGFWFDDRKCKDVSRA